MTETNVILRIYRGLISLRRDEDGIPVHLRPTSVVGTVQDDPFDCWVEKVIKKTLSKDFEVFHSGTLTTPDLVVRDKKSGLIYGNSFYYFLLDEVAPEASSDGLITLSNIFDACKLREVKERVAYIPVIPA